MMIEAFSCNVIGRTKSGYKPFSLNIVYFLTEHFFLGNIFNKILSME
jgi:hypothetical protein